MLFKLTEFIEFISERVYYRVGSQNDRFNQLRALVDLYAQMNNINLHAMRRLVIKATETPDRIIGVNQQNAMSAHEQVILTILAKSGMLNQATISYRQKKRKNFLIREGGEFLVKL